MVDTIIAVLSLVVGILGLYFTIRNRSAPTRANTVLPTTSPRVERQPSIMA